jgi:invasion protein IalB
MPTDYWPFKNRKTIGPGPKGRVTERKDKWACKCERVSKKQSVCKCVSRITKPGKRPRRKTVRIDLEKKRKYGKLWRRYTKEIRAKQKRAAAKRSAA